MTMLTGAAYSAMALLFAYGLNALLSPNMSYLRSRSNLIAGMWLVVAFVEFFAYVAYAWNFGFASERMVCSLVISFADVGATSSAGIFQSHSSSERCILRSRRAFHRNVDTNAGTRGHCNVWSIGAESWRDSDGDFRTSYRLCCGVKIQQVSV